MNHTSLLPVFDMARIELFPIHNRLRHWRHVALHSGMWSSLASARDRWMRIFVLKRPTTFAHCANNTHPFVALSSQMAEQDPACSINTLKSGGSLVNYDQERTSFHKGRSETFIPDLLRMMKLPPALLVFLPLVCPLRLPSIPIKRNVISGKSTFTSLGSGTLSRTCKNRMMRLIASRPVAWCPHLVTIDGLCSNSCAKSDIAAFLSDSLVPSATHAGFMRLVGVGSSLCQNQRCTE